MSSVVLVTGGAGYVGSHACKRLAAHGYTPVVYDNLSRGHAEFVKWGPLERGDVRDRERLLEVMRRHRPKVVLHFAAYAYVGESLAQPLDYYALNVGGVSNVLDAMRLTDCANIVFSSTCATYGNPARVPISEDDPQSPISPYGASKQFAERVIRDAAQAHGFGWLPLRYFNAAGDDPDLEIGEWHEPEPHVIPRLLAAALSDASPPFEVLGNDYPTPDGTALRDYVHVDDLAEAHVAAVAHLLRGGVSGPVNLGNERGVSVLDLVRAVEAVTGRKLPLKFSPRRVGDPPAAIADSRLARERLGWTPATPDIESIIETAVRWHRHAPQTLAQ